MGHESRSLDPANDGKTEASFPVIAEDRVSGSAHACDLSVRVRTLDESGACELAICPADGEGYFFTLGSHHEAVGLVTAINRARLFAQHQGAITLRNAERDAQAAEDAARARVADIPTPPSPEPRKAVPMVPPHLLKGEADGTLTPEERGQLHSLRVERGEAEPMDPGYEPPTGPGMENPHADDRTDGSVPPAPPAETPPPADNGDAAGDQGDGSDPSDDPQPSPVAPV